MGIALREQKIDLLDVIDFLNVCRVEFLAGNGKVDITANRNKLKREKAASISEQLKAIIMIAAWFGQELFSTVIQADITQRFLTQAEKDAEQLLLYDSDLPWHFTGLKYVFPDKNIHWWIKYCMLYLYLDVL